MLSLDFLEKGLRLVSAPHLENDFSRKILLTDHISLSDCLFFLRYRAICVASVCFPGCDIINFEIKLISLLKLFFYMNKMSRQTFKYLRPEIDPLIYNKHYWTVNTFFVKHTFY